MRGGTCRPGLGAGGGQRRQEAAAACVAGRWGGLAVGDLGGGQWLPPVAGAAGGAAPSPPPLQAFDTHIHGLAKLHLGGRVGVVMVLPRGGGAWLIWSEEFISSKPEWRPLGFPWEMVPLPLTWAWCLAVSPGTRMPGADGVYGHHPWGRQRGNAFPVPF